MKPLNALLLIACAAPLHAEEFSPNWRWNAFASQGAIYTSDNNFYGESDDSVSTEYREIGLLLGAEPIDNLQLAGQLLSRRAGEVDKTDLQVDYAFASYDLWSGVDSTFGIKAGRVRAPLGFYNETRDVAHTRPGILLPQSIYPERMRDLLFSRDGVQLYGSYQFGLNTLSLDVSYGELTLDSDDYQELVGVKSLPGKVDTPYTPIARLIWDWDLGRVRAGLTYADFSADYEPVPGQQIDVKFDYWVLSAEYNSAKWSLTGEYSVYDADMGDLDALNSILSSSQAGGMVDPSLYAGMDPGLLAALAGLGQAGAELRVSKGYGYYVQGTYRFLPGWDAFLRWDVSYLNEDNRSDPAVYTRDLVTGLGWRPDSNWLLRAEWHLVEGNAALSTNENDATGMEKYWQMLLFQISYRI